MTALSTARGSPLKFYRVAHWLWRHQVPVLPLPLKAFIGIVFAAVVPSSARIGRGVLFSYHGLGAIIHKRTVFGDGAVIGAGVTIDCRSGLQQVPVIGENAMIGTGAKILGPVTVSRGASIGASAVVLDDVPDYGVAVGIPAKVIRINSPDQLPDYKRFSTADPADLA